MTAAVKTTVNDMAFADACLKGKQLATTTTPPASDLGASL